MYRRTLHSSSGHPTLREAITSLLVTELMHPSKEIYLISSNLSDVPLIDNQLESYSDLFPRVRRRWIHLSDILLTLASKGSSVRVICDPTQSQTQNIIAELHEKIEMRRLHSHPQEGLFTERLLMRGVLQFADRGIYVGRESVWIGYDPTEVRDELTLARRFWEEARRL